MGMHRRGSNPAHARDGTPKRGMASHARPALPAPSLMARRGGASGIPKRSIPPPIKTWLGKSAGGRLMAVYCSTSWRVWTPSPVSPTPTPGRGMVDWCHQTGAGAERTLAGPSKGGGGILRWPSAAQGGRRTLGSLSDRRGRRARRPVERNGRSESVWRPFPALGSAAAGARLLAVGRFFCRDRREPRFSGNSDERGTTHVGGIAAREGGTGGNIPRPPEAGRTREPAACGRGFFARYPLPL